MFTDNKGKWSVALLAILLGFALAFVISDVKAEDIPVPKLMGRVNDYASALSPDQRTKLEAQLKELETFPNKPQVAVLIVNTTGDDGIDAFKNKVFNAWKLGNAQTDNGLLTVLAVQDRKIGTEVGYGNEPYFTDGRMAQIRTQIMNPYLKKGEWYNALSAETAEFKKIFAANPQEVVAKNKSTNSSHGGFGWMFILFALLCVGGVVLFIRSQRERRSTRYDRDDNTPYSYTPPSRPQPSGSYSNPYGNRTSRPSPFDTDPTPTPSAYREKDHTMRDSAIGGFAGGVAGSVIGNEISRRRRRDDDDDDTPSRSSSSYSSDTSSSSGSSWSSSDSSSSSSSSSDSSSSYSGDGGSSGGGGDSGGF